MAAVNKEPDKRKIRGEETRKQIIQAAIISIASRGLSNMTLDRVAERIGISRALVVFHFKSKSNLIEEVLNFLGAQYSEGWHAAYNLETSSNIKKLLNLVDFDISFAYENPQYISAWHAFWGESKGNMLYRNLSFPRDEDYSTENGKLIGKLIDEGNYNPDELQSINLALGAMLFGIWVESHLEFDPDDCQSYKNAVRLFLRKMLPNHTIEG